MKNVTIILISVSLNAFAQILMRRGMLKIGKISIVSQEFFRSFPLMFTNAFLWTAFFCYGVSIVLWMIVLSRFEVSFAYAFSSLGFVLVTIMGAVLLKESISPLRIAGIGIICLGIILVAKG
jgi:drug/metabolite transporter (DMT)-like permease